MFRFVGRTFHRHSLMFLFCYLWHTPPVCLSEAPRYLVHISICFQMPSAFVIGCFCLDFGSYEMRVFSNLKYTTNIGFKWLDQSFSSFSCIGLDLIFTNLNTSLTQLILSFNLLTLSFFGIGQKFFLLNVTDILVERCCSKADFEADLEAQHDLRSIHGLS